MRVGALHLKRYGHFTDRSIALPPGQPDLHIIFGPNEAGKSTLLSAVEDLLFGIPSRSRLNFLHSYSDLLVGAVLEKDDAVLEVFRRKGNRQTLLDVHGLPFNSGDDQTLGPFLAMADRPFFARMFSLDGQRLQQGGRDILEAKDDAVGQQLFSASAGLHGLPETFRALSHEADGLWGPRPAKHRKFYQVKETLKVADQALQDQTVTASRWQELRQHYEEAETAYQQVQANLGKAMARHHQLSRIRRVLGDVRRKQELETQLKTLSQVVALPENAAKTLETAEQQDRLTTTRIAMLAERRTRVQEELKGLTVNQAVLLRGEEIRWIHERCIQIRVVRADLPKRQAEYRAMETALCQLAAEVEWSRDDMPAWLGRLPTRTRLSAARRQLNQAGRLHANVDNAAASCRDHESWQKQLQQDLLDLGNPVDASSLTIAIRTVERKGDVAGRVRSAEMQVKAVEQRLQQEVLALRPPVDDINLLRSMPVPPRAAVEDHQQQQQDWQRRERERQQQQSGIQQEQERVIAARQQLIRDGQTVTTEVLTQARQRRDQLWHVIQLKYINHQPIPAAMSSGLMEEAKDWAAALAPAMAQVDQLADRRFDRAKASAQVAELERKIAENTLLLQQYSAVHTKLAAEGAALKARWAALWAGAGVEPLDPMAMLDWLDRRTSILQARSDYEQAHTVWICQQKDMSEAKELLLTELARPGVDRTLMETLALPMLLEKAIEEHNRSMGKIQRKRQMEAGLKAAEGEVKRWNQTLKEARQHLETWQQQWRDTIGDLGLAVAAPDVIAAQIDAIEQLGEKKRSLNALKADRIDRMAGNITAFEQEAQRLIQAVAPDLAGQFVDDAVHQTALRLDEAERVRTLRQKKEEEETTLGQQIAEREAELQLSKTAVEALRKRAGVTTNSALKEAIHRSDQRQMWQQERQQITAKLQGQSDGLTVKELEQECARIDIDVAVAQQAGLQQEIEALQQQLSIKAEQRSQARQAFEVIGGHDAAARAAADRQAALCEMEAVANRYVQTKLAAILLQWAIERYRSEKQAPLLQRAGELFALVTRQSFTGLQVQFDHKDQARLTGKRPSGKLVPVSGMSTGSADQLYLALRIAAVEDYINRAGPLPFVADDLFVHFDDDRAAAGLQLLHQLAQTTQVLFLTHHRHLVDLARQTLGPAVHIVRL